MPPPGKSLEPDPTSPVSPSAPNLKPPVKAVPRVSLVDRTCECLRSGLREGRWAGRLPPSRRLCAELGVAQNTLLAAQSRLVSEGLLRRAGRKSLEITAERTRVSGAPLRVAFLLANDYVRTGVLLRELLSEAQTALENEGTSAFTSSTRTSPRTRPARISRRA